MLVDARIMEALEAIQSDPGADSRALGLGPSVLNDLQAGGLIKASFYERWGEGDLYSNIRLTLRGEAYLEKPNLGNEKPGRPAPAWYSNPFLIAILAILSGLAAWGMAHYMGWS